MNLVAKEGPAVNTKNGVLVLSESTGAFQQLQNGSLVISPCDIQTTAEALHEALTMNPEERRSRAEILRAQVEGNDINAWFCDQINEISRLGYLP
jgi:trehalose 6-phosphate synthase